MARDRFSLEEDKTLDVVNDVRELASARLMPIVPMKDPYPMFLFSESYGVNKHVTFWHCRVRYETGMGLPRGFLRWRREISPCRLKNISLAPER